MSTTIPKPSQVDQWVRNRVRRRADVRAQVRRLEDQLETTLAVRGVLAYPAPVDGDTLARIHHMNDRELTAYAADTIDLRDALQAQR